MAEKLTNITAQPYRCGPIASSCPAVYRDRTPERYRCDISLSCHAVLDDDSSNFVFIGERLDPLPEELAGKVGDTEAAVKLSADLVLSSLGMTELQEATEITIADIRLFSNSFDDGSASKDFCIGIESRLRSALSKISGGESAQ